MKISIKTLQGKPTELEVTENDTLTDIKAKISAQMNVDPANQKLIHYGKVMTDENKKLAEYGVKDKDFLVLMITKVTSNVTNLLESTRQGRARCSEACSHNPTRGPTSSACTRSSPKTC